jgi:hypothetical protein
MILLKWYTIRLSYQTFLGKTSRIKCRSSSFITFAFSLSNKRAVKEKISKLKMTFTNFLTNFSLLTHKSRINTTIPTSKSGLSKTTLIGMITIEEVEAEAKSREEEDNSNKLNRGKTVPISF